MNDRSVNDGELSAYLDGEASREEVQRISALLAHDAKLQSRLAALSSVDEQVRDALTTLSVIDGKDPLIDEIRGSVVRGKPRSRRLAWQRWQVPSALAAGILIGVIATGLLVRQERVEDHWHRDVAAFHEQQLRSSDQVAPILDFPGEASLLPAAKRHLGSDVRIPQFIEAGYAIQGARIAPTAQGVGFLVVYHRPPRDWLTLGIRRSINDPQPADTPFTSWQGQQYEYSLRGAKNQDEQARLFRAAYEQTQ